MSDLGGQEVSQRHQGLVGPVGQSGRVTRIGFPLVHPTASGFLSQKSCSSPFNFCGEFRRCAEVSGKRVTRLLEESALSVLLPGCLLLGSW